MQVTRRPTAFSTHRFVFYTCFLLYTNVDPFRACRSGGGRVGVLDVLLFGVDGAFWAALEAGLFQFPHDPVEVGALGRGLVPALLYEAVQGGREVLGELGAQLLLCDEVRDVLRVVLLVGLLLAEEFPEDDPEGVDVDGLVVLLPAKYFRGDPARGPADGHGPFLLEDPGEAKVADLAAKVCVEEEVLCLEVPVDDLRGHVVQVLHGLRGVHGDVEDEPPGEAVGGALVDHLEEGGHGAGHELGNNAKIRLQVDCPEEAEDARVAQHAADLDLLRKVLDEVVLVLLGVLEVYPFDGDVVALVVGLADLPVGPVPDGLPPLDLLHVYPHPKVDVVRNVHGRAPVAERLGLLPLLSNELLVVEVEGHLPVRLPLNERVLRVNDGLGFLRLVAPHDDERTNERRREGGREGGRKGKKERRRNERGATLTHSHTTHSLARTHTIIGGKR